MVRCYTSGFVHAEEPVGRSKWLCPAALPCMHGSCTPEHRSNFGKLRGELHGLYIVDAFGIYHGGAACNSNNGDDILARERPSSTVCRGCFRAIHAVKKWVGMLNDSKNFHWTYSTLRTGYPRDLSLLNNTPKTVWGNFLYVDGL